MASQNQLVWQTSVPPFAVVAMSSTSLAASSYLTGSELDDDGANTIRQPSLDFSDNEGTDDEHTGDYSTRMEELLGEGEDESDVQEDDEETDGGGGFLYTGVDAADISAGYRDRLRDVLGADAEQDDETEVHEVERSLLLHSGESENLGFDDDELPVSLVRVAITLHVCVLDVDLFLCTHSMETFCRTIRLRRCRCLRYL